VATQKVTPAGPGVHSCVKYCDRREQWLLKRLLARSLRVLFALNYTSPRGERRIIILDWPSSPVQMRIVRRLKKILASRRDASSRNDERESTQHKCVFEIILSRSKISKREFIARDENERYSNLFILFLFAKKTRRFRKRKSSKLIYLTWFLRPYVNI